MTEKIEIEWSISIFEKWKLSVPIWFRNIYCNLNYRGDFLIFRSIWDELFSIWKLLEWDLNQNHTFTNVLFVAKQNSIWCQINRKRVATNKMCCNLTRFRSLFLKFSPWKSVHSCVMYYKRITMYYKTLGIVMYYNAERLESPGIMGA